MFRPASRALLRAPTSTTVAVASRRLVSTGPSGPAPSSKSRSLKNVVVRLGLAAGAVYYYNTSSVFADPKFSFKAQPPQYASDGTSHIPTLDSITPKIRQERQKEAAANAQQSPSDPQALEEEASQEAAFDPETGEINWDCPCLGGMAHGPCGEAFKAAFSCFVFSKEEPKGIDCIEKFKGMQDCFRAHPDVYGSELEDDNDTNTNNNADPNSDTPSPSQSPATSASSEPSTREVATAAQLDASSHPDEKHARAKEVHSQVSAASAQAGEQAESDQLMPKAWHDTDNKNEKCIHGTSSREGEGNQGHAHEEVIEFPRYLPLVSQTEYEARKTCPVCGVSKLCMKKVMMTLQPIDEKGELMGLFVL